ncbi:MAG: patatin-like phospholipase family protein [Faecalibacillus sp.]
MHLKQALVLSGGGAKGAYETGCIKALQELNFEFDIVTGTSIGAFNGLLLAQQDYDKLYHLWDTLSIEMVLKDPIHLDLSIESFMKNTGLIKPFVKSFVDKKGADNEPLKQLVRSLYDGQKAKNSPIRFGCCTVQFPQLKPLEITVDEMTVDNMIEYAIASASCFPAFPIHYIDKQGYIDGGYYDNLPIHLAFQMGATHILAIELNQDPTHSYLLNRDNITFIRPSRNLGGFLDFQRDMLNWRIRLGYLDTMKTFGKISGYQFAFKNEPVDLELARCFHNEILKYEIENNHHTFSIEDRTPLLTILKENTYLEKLELKDYLILGLELYMESNNYQSDKLYHFDDIIHEIQSLEINDNDYRYLNLLKKSGEILKDLTSKQIVNYFLSHFLNPEHSQVIPENIFYKEYLLAMFIYCIKKG